jgi:hypothetical protein
VADRRKILTEAELAALREVDYLAWLRRCGTKPLADVL